MDDLRELIERRRQEALKNVRIELSGLEIERITQEWDQLREENESLRNDVVLLRAKIDETVAAVQEMREKGTKTFDPEFQNKLLKELSLEDLKDDAA